MVFVKEIMTKKVFTLPKDNSLASLVKLMTKNNVSCVVAMNKGKVAGLVTERDLIRKIVLREKTTKNLKIKDIMTRDLISLPPDASLIEANHTMKRHVIRHLPILDKGKLCGIVTQTDLAREAGAIEIKNKTFMTYQNVQSLVIIIFFAFLAAYLVYVFMYLN